MPLIIKTINSIKCRDSAPRRSRRIPGWEPLNTGDTGRYRPTPRHPGATRCDIVIVPRWTSTR